MTAPTDEDMDVDNMTVVPIEPGGWCFFESVAVHVAQHPREGVSPVYRGCVAVGALAMELLAGSRMQFAQGLEVDERARTTIWSTHGMRQ